MFEQVMKLILILQRTLTLCLILKLKFAKQTIECLKFVQFNSLEFNQYSVKNCKLQSFQNI